MAKSTDWPRRSTRAARARADRAHGGRRHGRHPGGGRGARSRRRRATSSPPVFGAGWRGSAAAHPPAPAGALRRVAGAAVPGRPLGAGAGRRRRRTSTSAREPGAHSAVSTWDAAAARRPDLIVGHAVRVRARARSRGARRLRDAAAERLLRGGAGLGARRQRLHLAAGPTHRGRRRAPAGGDARVPRCRGSRRWPARA